MALQVAVHAAAVKSVLLCSPQLSGDDLVARHAKSFEHDALQARISRSATPPGLGDSSENPEHRALSAPSVSINLAEEAVRLGGERTAGLKLRVLDIPRLRVRDLCSDCASLARSEGLDLIVVRRDRVASRRRCCERCSR